MEYAIAAWHPYKKKDIDIIEKVQRRATKIVPSLKHLTYAERLKELNIPTLSYRRIRGDMIETFKIMTGKYDKEVAPNLKMIDPDIPTRGHKYKLSKIRTITTIRKNFFTNRITNIWNSYQKLLFQPQM